MKNMRLVLHPMFAAISSSTDQEQSWKDFDAKKADLLSTAGWTDAEFDKAQNEYYIDFTNDDPAQWIIRHDPANAKILIKQDKTA